MLKKLEDHPTGFGFEPGTHELIGYTVTIMDDYNRLVPDTNPDADCTIAAIGDSMTYGGGVNDDETWVNLLAQAFPDVHFLNTGRPAYAASEIRELYRFTEADGYIYFIINNDIMPESGMERLPENYRLPNIFGLYRAGISNRYNFEHITEQEFEVADFDTFWATLGEFSSGGDVMMFTYDYWEITEETVERFPEVLVIPYTDDRVSWYDAHPNATGHQAIFDSIRDDVAALIEEQCG